MSELTKEDKKKLIKLLLYECRIPIVLLTIITLLIYSNLEPNLSFFLPCLISLAAQINLALTLVPLDAKVDKKFKDEMYFQATCKYTYTAIILIFIWDIYCCYSLVSSLL